MGFGIPWRFWHQDEKVGIIAGARAGDLHPRMAQSMNMAQEHDRRGIPVMLAAWYGPDWTTQGLFTPAGPAALPIPSFRADVTVAARGDVDRGTYIV